MVRQKASGRVAILVLAVLAATAPGLSQPPLGADTDRLRQIVETIEQEEARNGAHSEGLIRPLSELAALYQDQGDPARAVAAIHRVLEVVRANEGVHSLEQIPLLRRLIANEEAIGRFETAWELEQDLLALAKRYPDDLRTVPVFRDTADKRMRLLREYLAGESPPQIVIGCYHGWPHRVRRNGYDDVESGDCTAGSRHDVVRAVVSDAQTNYADAIAVILRNELYESVELRELELGLLRSIDALRGTDTGPASRAPITDRALGSFDREPWRSWKLAMLRLIEWNLPQPGPGGAAHDDPLVDDPDMGDVDRAPPDDFIGSRSVERLLAYEIAAGAPVVDQAEALVRVADWYFVHGSSERALEGYALARKMLGEAGAQRSIDELFAPKTPVVLPAFLSNPLASSETPASTGHIDVAFEISRYGESRRIRILDTTTNATDAAKKRLVQAIQGSRFRPRMTDGELDPASQIVLRYYLTE